MINDFNEYRINLPRLINEINFNLENKMKEIKIELNLKIKKLGISTRNPKPKAPVFQKPNSISEKNYEQTKVKIVDERDDRGAISTG